MAIADVPAPRTRQDMIRAAARLFARTPQDARVIESALARREALGDTYIPPLRAHLLHCKTAAVDGCRLGYLRLPHPIGHSVSLVSALILGDAAVSAGLLSTPMVIVSALTAICAFVVPNLYEPVTVLRLLFILAGGLLGPVGMVALFLYMLFNLCSMNAFGIPYTAPLAPASRAFLRDGLLRRSWRTLAKSDFSIRDLAPKEGEDGTQSD